LMAKLPKRGHTPVIGGRAHGVTRPQPKDRMACIFIIGVASKLRPIMIGGCVDIWNKLEELQGAHYEEIKVRDLFWLPDMGVAQRLVNATHKVIDQHRIRGYWFGVTVADGVTALKAASASAKIPFTTNQEYKKICKSPTELDDHEFDKLISHLGFLGLSTKDSEG
jgi:hypothetical protein